MSQKLLDEKELQEAINYQIISPSFAERVRELIKAHEQNAAQQSVQATSGWTCLNCGWLNGDLWQECPNCKTTRA